MQSRVFGVLETPARKDTLPRGYTDLVLDAVRQGFIIPAPLNLSAYAAYLVGGAGAVAPVAIGEVEFTLDPLGKVSDIHLTQTSLSPAIDRNLYAAPARADSLQLFPAQAGVSDQGKIRFFVALTSDERAGDRMLQFFTVRLPAWRPGSAATIDPHQDYEPFFPVTARQAGVSDSVAVELVADEKGVPIPTTVRLITARTIDYARVVVDAVLKSRYIPATAAGCPVKGVIHRGWTMTMTKQYE